MGPQQQQYPGQQQFRGTIPSYQYQQNHRRGGPGYTEPWRDYQYPGASYGSSTQKVFPHMPMFDIDPRVTDRTSTRYAPMNPNYRGSQQPYPNYNYNNSGYNSYQPPPPQHRHHHDRVPRYRYFGDLSNNFGDTGRRGNFWSR